jgi:hypothetical protein
MSLYPTLLLVLALFHTIHIHCSQIVRQLRPKQRRQHYASLLLSHRHIYLLTGHKLHVILG